jgi:PTH1 family peptidyl-tRNA hydrolase
VGEGTIGDSPAVLAKPRSFVNDSGSAVGSLLTRYRASVADLVVVHDDLDLPSGKLRVRSGGGAGGHRGVKSVIDAVGTQAFARVRVGIGRPPEGVDEVDYVLGTMSREERERVGEAVEHAAQAVLCLLTAGVDEAMNRFN